LTSGPQQNPNKSINVGVAAHITAASLGGPRYNSALTSQERESIENGIWLCQKCAKLVDNDEKRYSVEILFDWKRQAEKITISEVERGQRPQLNTKIAVFEKLEKIMLDLLNEMRTDLAKYPLRREFVLLKKEWFYWAKGNELVYFYNDHSDLDDKIRILENYNLVREITYNNTKRYLITEELADYLITEHINNPA
jgi:hypothetical protein